MSDNMNNIDLISYGWTAVQRSHAKSLESVAQDTPAQISVDDMKLPDSMIANKTLEYAKGELPENTFNHSLRVYYYGAAIVAHHFPEWTPMLETYFLTCMLHDIGTTDEHLADTKMSFEYFGGFLALNFLRLHGAPRDQAESVAEAIVRHADLGDTGKLTTLGLLIQLSTVFDNIGANAFLIHTSTIETVVNAFPRNNWSTCFAATMRKEVGTKPWCHSTMLEEEGFLEAIVGNEVMAPYE